MFLLNKPIHVDNLYFGGIVWWVSNDLWSYYMVVLDTPANGRYLPIIAKPISVYLDYQKDKHQKVTFEYAAALFLQMETGTKKIKEWTESPYLIMEDPKYNFGSLDIIQVCFLNWIFIIVCIEWNTRNEVTPHSLCISTKRPDHEYTWDMKSWHWLLFLF